MESVTSTASTCNIFRWNRGFWFRFWLTVKLIYTNWQRWYFLFVLKFRDVLFAWKCQRSLGRFWTWTKCVWFLHTWGTGFCWRCWRCTWRISFCLFLSWGRCWVTALNLHGDWDRFWLFYGVFPSFFGFYSWICVRGRPFCWRVSLSCLKPEIR